MAEYIDKKTAIDSIGSNYCMDCENSNGILCRACAHQDDMDIIDSIPAADVQLIEHSKWICVNDEENVYMCDKCGGEVIFIEGNPTNNEYAYCMYCGAKIDLPETTKG